MQTSHRIRNEHQKPRLPRQHLSQVRVPAGLRNSGIAQLNHGICPGDLILQEPPGFGHMSGIPVDLLFTARDTFHLVHVFLFQIIIVKNNGADIASAPLF